jgi:hypothetical protein
MTTKPIPQHERVLGMTHSTWGYVTWSITAFVIVLGVELLAKDITGVAPWPSLSYTTRKLIADHHWIALLMLFALLTFVVHILNPGKWGV